MRPGLVYLSFVAMIPLAASIDTGEQDRGSILRTALAASDGRRIVDVLRESQQSAIALSSYGEKAALMREISAPFSAIAWRGTETLRLLSEVESACRSEEFLLHLALTRIPWDVLEEATMLDSVPCHLPDKIEHGLIALRNAPDPDWFAIAATTVCYRLPEKIKYDAAVDSARVYLAHPGMSEAARAAVSCAVGRLMATRLVLQSSHHPPLPEEVCEAESLLQAARQSAGASEGLWAAATLELASLRFATGDSSAAEKMLEDVIAHPDVPAIQKADACASLAHSAERRERWELALARWVELKNLDQEHAIHLGFDLDNRIQELKQKLEER
ncbi:hypothetical protein JXA88_06705 [Candidatus Fermentibacteria bacterium]|nr:hypothetical protein [Candidatus Fermentibacteria bacterium]